MNDIAPVDVSVPGQPRSYSIVFDELSALGQRMYEAGLQPGRCVLITDENVQPLYGETVMSSLEDQEWKPRSLTLPAGEPTKSLSNLSNIYDRVLEWGIDRTTPVIGLGGGVIGDLAGFAAATLLRGVPLVHVPTTLIGQADSAIGGKTGINHSTGKNLVGAFYQPELVHADVQTLKSLPYRQWTSGLAEVVKYALITDGDLFGFLANNWNDVLSQDDTALRRIVPDSAEIKARIVEEDEEESGRRAILNFGHTVGHAIEKSAGYGQFTHGEAIALGMLASLHMSQHCHPNTSFDDAIGLVKRLPIRHSLEKLTFDEIWHTMHSDKKAQKGNLFFVLLRQPGLPYLTGEIPRKVVEESWTFTKKCAKSLAERHN